MNRPAPGTGGTELSHRSPRTPGLLLLLAAVALGIDFKAVIDLSRGPWVAAGAQVLVLLAGVVLPLALTHRQEAYCERGECHQGVCYQAGPAAGEVPDGS
ncbi:hypothetical protein [Kitasatospora sp. NPDC088783]|uniref:hypothetical protein n=1 Tax=Kitasatospora sp. NPDC088783 TaxID=3364077 RepID=UPI003826162B